MPVYGHSSGRVHQATKAVNETTHASFDKHTKIFRMFAGTSMYAFRIHPNLSLEHLYFGAALNSLADLEYLSFQLPRRGKSGHVNIDVNSTDDWSDCATSEEAAHTRSSVSLQGLKQMSADKAGGSSSTHRVSPPKASSDIAKKSSKKSRGGYIAFHSPDEHARLKSDGLGGSGPKQLSVRTRFESSSDDDSDDAPSFATNPSQLEEFRKSVMSQPRVKHLDTAHSIPRNVQKLSEQAKLRHKQVGHKDGALSKTSAFVSEQEKAWISFQSQQGSSSPTGGKSPASPAGSQDDLNDIVHPANFIDVAINPVENIIRGSTNITNVYDSVGWDSDDPLYSKAMEARINFKEHEAKQKDAGRESKKSHVSTGVFPDPEIDCSIDDDLNLVSSFQSVKLAGDSDADTLHSSLAKPDSISKQEVEWSDTDFAVVDAGERPVYPLCADPTASDDERERNERVVDRDDVMLSQCLLQNLANLEFSFGNSTDPRSASFGLKDDFDGSTEVNLRYVSHQIYAGKVPMPDDMPAVHVTSKNDASSIVVVLADVKIGLEVHLIYVCMHEYNVITRRVTYVNVDNRPLSCASTALAAASAVSPAVVAVGPVPAQNGTAYASKSSSHVVDGSQKCYKVLNKAHSFTLDLPSSSDSWYITSLSDSGGVECTAKTTLLNPGVHKIDSVSSSLDSENEGKTRHSPFIALSAGSQSERIGEVIGFALVYSGCFRMEADVDNFNRMRINIGMGDDKMSWHLGRGEVFNTPEVVLGRSDEGLGGLSRTLHNLFRECIVPRAWLQVANAPIMLNTWEACTDVNHDNIIRVAQKASQIGIDLVVIDASSSGWFGQEHEKPVYGKLNSLGTPALDPKKFPLGLGMLVREVNNVGVKVGLFFKPEVTVPGSALHMLNPDYWLLVRAPGTSHAPAEEKEEGNSRLQMQMDLSNPQVVDYMFAGMSALISAANIEYIFWDMDHALDALASGVSVLPTLSAFRSDRQTAEKSMFESETMHRYILGMYRVLHRLIKSFPLVVIDSTFSRGGSFDPGMLSCCSTIWALSTHADPWKSVRNFYSASIVYPARSIGNLVTFEKPGKSNDAYVRTSILIFMLGNLGFHLDLNNLSAERTANLRNQIGKFKKYRHLTLQGDMYRLWNPAIMPACAIQFISKNKTEVLVLVLCRESAQWADTQCLTLRLDGLVPHAKYEITESYPAMVAIKSDDDVSSKSGLTAQPLYQFRAPAVELNGDTLMNAGLALKFYSADDSKILYIKRCCHQPVFSA